MVIKCASWAKYHSMKTAWSLSSNINSILKMILKMENKRKFDRPTIKKLFEGEKTFISELFSILCIPSHEQDEEEDGDVYVGEKKPSRDEARKNQRAKSFQELNDRLKKLQGTKDFSLKNKLMKKSLSRRIKKKNRKDERSAKRKLVKMKKKEVAKVKKETDTDEPVEKVVKPKSTKPVFNSQGKVVFSKFDFSESGIPEDKKKGERDPKKILESLKKQKETVSELKQSGEIDKAVHVMEKVAWKNALAKAEGQKVKDDPLLLKKTVKKQEQKKKQSAKKWEQRLNTVEKAKHDKQKKRDTNLLKRKQEKKKKVMKKAVKKGRMIP